MNCLDCIKRCSRCECMGRDLEAVADHLDACFRDQARSGHGWDGVKGEMLSAMQHIAHAEDLAVWCDGTGESREQESRQRLLAAAAHLLNISSMVEAMRRAER
jgi:hypothetical protein